MALSAAAIASSGCGHSSTDDTTLRATEKVIKVTAAPVEVKSLSRTVEVVGSLRGWEEVTLGAKKGGRVLKVLHDMGDTVKPGEPLVVLDPVDADLAINQARRKLDADLARLGLDQFPPPDKFQPDDVPSVVQAKVALDKSKITLRRERELNSRRAGVAETLEFAVIDERDKTIAVQVARVQARADFENARASQAALVVAQQGQADLVTLTPNPTEVPHPNPVYGIRKRFVSVGQMIREGDSLYELVITNPLRVWVNVPERFIRDIRCGQHGTVEVPAYPAEPFAAEVVRINPAIDPNTRTFQVELKVPNDDGRLHPGGFARASIGIGENPNATVVPIEAVVDFAGSTKLFLLEGDVAREVKVKRGVAGRGWVEVVGEVPAGSRVITTGQGQIAEGSRVELRESPPATDTPKAQASAASRGEGAPSRR